MIKVLFVCHGNICRSPLAQSIFQYLVDKQGLHDGFIIDSAATSREEIGNPPHYGTKTILKEKNIPLQHHYARQLTINDGNTFDYLIGMDQRNVENICKMVPHSTAKIMRLLDLSNQARDIADPWYTGNFDITFDDVMEGCQLLLEYLLNKQ